MSLLGRAPCPTAQPIGTHGQGLRGVLSAARSRPFSSAQSLRRPLSDGT